MLLSDAGDGGTMPFVDAFARIVLEEVLGAYSEREGEFACGFVRGVAHRCTGRVGHFRDMTV